MKRWLLAACLVAALAVQPIVAAGIVAGYRGTDGAAAATAMVISTSAPAFSSLPSGTILVWVRSDNVSNTARAMVGKSVTNGGVSLVRPAADGTQFHWNMFRPTTSLRLASPTGSLRVGIPQFVVVQWDIATSGNNLMWLGDLLVPAAVVTPSVTLGSGTPASDATQPMNIGNASAGSSGWPGVIWALGISSASLTLDEIRRAQFNLSPSSVRRCVGLWTFNRLPAVNLCGNGGTGRLTGSGRLSSDALPRVTWRRPGL